MKIFKTISCLSAFLLFAEARAESASATPGTQNIPVETHLRVDVKSDTENIVFVTDTADPDVVTKGYKLKNASPWVIRGYILNAVGGSGGTLATAGSGAKKIDENLTKVEAIEYNDGTGMLVVSAEEYKFDKQVDGALSIDELVDKLDLPNVVDSSGSAVIMYFPVSRMASTLKTLLEEVGALVDNTANGVDRSRTIVTVDTELNALVILTPRFKKKDILRMISEYDRPLPEAKIKCTIYEINIENDDKVGNDFQAWKNGMGSDAFSMGAEYSYNWSGTAASGALSGNGWQNVDFIQFSPQWSTKYLDFLQSNGYAKVVTSGEIEALNGIPGTITKSTYIPYFSNGSTALDGTTINRGVMTLTAGITAGSTVGVDLDGDTITAGAAIAANALTVTKITRGNSAAPAIYTLEIVSGSGFFSNNGVNIGKKVEVNGFDDATYTVTWQTTPAYSVGKGTAHNTSIYDYGYSLSITPSICAASTTLAVKVTNKSLIGYESNGAPRIVESEVQTEVMVANTGRKFAIGGVTNSSVVKVDSKVPILGDIPGLGWLFKTQYDAIKDTKMIAVIECELHAPNAPLSGGVLEAIGEIDGAISEKGR